LGAIGGGLEAFFENTNGGLDDAKINLAASGNSFQNALGGFGNGQRYNIDL
jgi:hypothetical protein